MIFPLIKRCLRPLLPNHFSSSQKVEKSPTGFQTIGGGGGGDARRKPASANALTGFTFNASEENVAEEANKEQQDDAFQAARVSDVEAGSASRTLAPTGEAVQEEWTQFQDGQRHSSAA